MPASQGARAVDQFFAGAGDNEQLLSAGGQGSALHELTGNAAGDALAEDRWFLAGMDAE
jgi:hypothetical protein